MNTDGPQNGDSPFYGSGSNDERERPLDERERPSLLPEFVRKMAVAGLGALFMTEEGLRSLAGQLKLPKEALQYILSQAEKTKDDIGRVVSEEVRRFLQSDKLRDEFLKLLTGMSVEIKAEVRLVPDSTRKDEAPTPQIHVADLSVHRRRRKKD